MQRTSRAYKTEQKGQLRNEQYIYVYLGVISREAQATAYANGNFTTYSDPQSIFGNNLFEGYYATAEQNMARCDASQFFIPRDRNSFALWQGLVTQNILGSVTFTFGTYKHLNIKGLTIDFGDYFPTSFSISNGHVSYTYEYTNESPGEWTCEDEFLDTEFIKITALQMIGGQQRLRIKSIFFGLGFVFDNSNLISTSWKTEVAHLSDALPSKSFSFTIDNSNRKFSADDPHSFVAFLEEQQDVVFEFGRRLDDGSIYRIPGGKLNLKSWSSNDLQAKFTAVGFMDYSNGTFNKGKYYSDGISLYDLAVQVCEDAGYKDYIIDSYLKKLKTHNPLPVEKHKNLLQLLANSAMGILRETRDGRIEIKKSFEPDIVSIDTNGHTEYSVLENLVNEVATFNEYATTEKNFVYADGHQFFMPRNPETEGLIDGGYVSTSTSKSNGEFEIETDNYIRFISDNGTITGLEFDGDITTNKGYFLANGLQVSMNEATLNNPAVTITWEASWTFFNLILLFSDVFPKTIMLHTYKDNELIESFAAEDTIGFETTIYHDFYDIDELVIEFVKTNPYQKIHLGKIIFGNITDYTLEYSDMSSTPTAVKTEFVKDINVIYSEYSYGTDVKSIGTVETIVGSNIYQNKKAHHNYSLAYKEINDDESTYTKASKAFVDELPSVDNGKSNIRYFVSTGTANQYYMYMLISTDGVKDWELKGIVTETIVNNLPETLQENVLYLVKTGTNLIYHLYMRYINGEDDTIISLGYDVRGTLQIIESGAFYVEYTSNVASPVTVSGVEFVISEHTYTKQLNDIGTDKTANNVLIDNLEQAQKESEWLADHYSNDVEYTIQYRGEPALDPDDQIFIENKFVNKNLVRITDTQINTSTGMSMTCTLHGRRISYIDNLGDDVARVDYAIVDVSEVADDETSSDVALVDYAIVDQSEVAE